MQAAVCTSSAGKAKVAYHSAASAHRALIRSRRWRRRSTIPVPYLCPDCHAFHVGRAQEDV